MPDLTIIGGGMTGLAAAWAAQKAGASYRLIEASDRLGGKVQTEHVEGFLLEAGPDSFLTEKPEGIALAREIGLEDQFLPCCPEPKVRILHERRLTPLPAGCRLFIPYDEARFRENTLLSTAGTERALAEIDVPIRPDEAGDESVGDFVTRRFGMEMFERVAGPVLAGIYGANPFQLSLKASFAKFAAMEQTHGSLIRAVQARRATAGTNGKRPSPFTSLRAGMQSLVDELVPRLTGELVLNQRVRSLPDGPVLLALPASPAAELLHMRHLDIAKALRAFRTVSTATVNLAYDRNTIDPPEGFGFMSTLADPSPLVGCTWVSNKFAGRSPDHGFLARAFVGGQKDQTLLELCDEALTQMVHAELSRLHPGLRTPPIFSRVARWHQGNPQYDLGHAERVQALARALPSNLELAGSAFRGVGLPDCIQDGTRAVQNLL